jgi:GNAT superfamily N-acetyltransferase
MRDLSVQPLEPSSAWLPQIAADQFEHWGQLTGFGSRKQYETFLEEAAQSISLPRVLIAHTRGTLLGSVNLLTSEMTIRPQFTPWMGQLFVAEGQRSLGVGAALLDAAASYVERQGYRQLFLFTYGTLPHYYRSRGWSDVEDVSYLGKVRTIMRLKIDATPQITFSFLTI